MSVAYELVTRNRAGVERRHEYVSALELDPGGVVRLEGRDWLIDTVEPSADGGRARAVAVPARYRLRLRHPDGREELGAFRRFRSDAPRFGHYLTTIEDGQPATWQVADERLDRDEQGEPYLDLVTERDFTELEELPDHQLEHALAGRDDELPAGAVTTLQRAADQGLAAELVALEPGEAPDWEQAERAIDALVFEEIHDDLVEMCGVDTSHDPPETWLDKIKERLRSDFELFRADVEGDHAEIAEWDFRDGRIFASVGSTDDESDPYKGHGWMCRLVDAEALGAAGFVRVRKADLS
jgi:hypothetical protein